MDYSILYGEIRKFFPTQAAFAEALGISECSLSKKMNNRSEWTGSEMKKACELLHSGPEAIQAYFFTPLVEKTQQS